jgi:hypothetical protein
VARHHRRNLGTWEIQAVAISWQGPDNPQRRGGAPGSLEVGSAHSRGVTGVMPCEPGKALEGADDHTYRKGSDIGHTQGW